MRFKGMGIAVVCAAAALCSSPAFGQMCNGASGAKGGASFSAHDKMFLKNSAQGNMTEIKLAQLALTKTSNDDVKDFAQRMVDDHTKLQENMKPFVEQAGVTPPSDLSAKDKMLEKKLSALSGDTFDKQYITAMVKDHHKDLGDFKTEVSSTKNSQLKDAVSQGEQVIQEHTTMIDGIAQKHGVSAPHSGSM